MAGKLIAFEGTDAVGKETQTTMLIKKLGEMERKTLYMKFPTYGKTPAGRLIEEHLQGKHGSKEKVSPYVASMMFALDRMQFREKIMKALREGTIIVCDRWKASNCAFQIAKLPESKWRDFFDWMQRLESPLPDADATIWIDVPPEKAFLHERKSQDIYEKDLQYQMQVRKVYAWMADFLPISRIDGFDGENHKMREKVFDESWRELERRGMFE